MANIKQFNQFDPSKGTSIKEESVAPTGPNDASARKAIANLVKIEGDIMGKMKERIKIAKEWAAGSDEERPDLLDQLRKCQGEIKKLQEMANKTEKEFNVASGVEVLEVEEVPVAAEVEEPIEAMEAEINSALAGEDFIEDDEEEPASAIQESPISESKKDDYLVFRRL